MVRYKSGHHQPYLCPACHQTFSTSFDSLYYRRHLSSEQIRASVTSPSAKAVVCAGLAGQPELPTFAVVSIIRSASQKA